MFLTCLCVVLQLQGLQLDLVPDAHLCLSSDAVEAILLDVLPLAETAAELMYICRSRKTPGYAGSLVLCCIPIPNKRQFIFISFV